MVCDKVVCVLVCVKLLYVKFVCEVMVCDMCGGGGGRREEEPGIQNQKQEPHTKLWGKTPGVRTTFGGSDVEKVHAVVARSTFRSQNVKTLGVRTTFGGSDVASRGRRKGLCTLSKVSKT